MKKQTKEAKKAKDFLKETSSQFVEKYPERLKLFLSQNESYEEEFINERLEYFENTVYDLKNAEGSSDGFSNTGIENFLLACEVVKEIGCDKFYFATKRKIEFLESKKLTIKPDTTVEIEVIEQVTPQQQPKPDHSTLLKALSKHVDGISPEGFTNIIEKHKLNGDQRAKWIGSQKSDAAYFAKVFKITMPEFKKCFFFQDGSELTASIRPTTKKPFKELLKPFIK